MGQILTGGKDLTRHDNSPGSKDVSGQTLMWLWHWLLLWLLLQTVSSDFKAYLSGEPADVLYRLHNKGKKKACEIDFQASLVGSLRVTVCKAERY